MKKFIEFIPHGAENAAPMDYLARLLNMPPRDVRREVFRARRAGHPICSSTGEASGGYYLPNSPEEARPYIHEQQARIRSANIALEAVEQFIEREGGARV